ncbi:MAG: aminotransferase class I/II, partial [Sulfurimonas sp.]
ISTAVIADAAMRERFEAEYRSIHFAEGTVFAHVAFEAAYSESEAWLDALLVHLKANQYKLQKMLQQHRHLITCTFPEGTYLAWLNCDKMALTDAQLRAFFIDDARLGLSPGLAFGKEGSRFMRLNFAVPSAVMDEALHRLDDALRSFVHA